MREPDSLTFDDVRAAFERLRGVVPATPMIRLDQEGPAELYLKLENLQPVRSFKLRGAFNAMALVDQGVRSAGVYTASAGNMAQGVAWAAARLGVPCTVVVPDNAPQTKLAGVRRLGAEVVSLPYDRWWDVLVTHRYEPLQPAHFVHPVSDVSVMAGNGTIGVEIVQAMPDVDAVLVPFGGGGLSCGIATAVHALRPSALVYGCEVETAAPLAAALAAGHVVETARRQTFVDGIGARSMLEEMWPPARRLLKGSLVVSLDEVAGAIRTVAERASLVMEGAAGAAVAAGLKGLGGRGKVVCVVSGGNIDLPVLATILGGRLP